MKKIIFAVCYIVLALIALLGIATVFHACTGMVELANGNSINMRCYWTAHVLMAISAVIVVLGILMLIFRNSEGIVKGLTFAAAVNAALMLVTPLPFLKISLFCGSAQMVCRTMTEPFAFVMSILLLVLPAIHIFMTKKNKED